MTWLMKESGKARAIAVLVVAVVVALGVLFVKRGWHSTASPQVVAENVPVTVVVMLNRVISVDADKLFRAGQGVQLSVRNRPRGIVKVDSVTVLPRKALLSKALEPHQWIPDENHPYESDVIVAFKDVATQSKQGYVTKGIKLKVGMGVTVETFSAYLHGTIMAIEADKPATKTNTSV